MHKARFVWIDFYITDSDIVALMLYNKDYPVPESNVHFSRYRFFALAGLNKCRDWSISNRVYKLGTIFQDSVQWIRWNGKWNNLVQQAKWNGAYAPVTGEKQKVALGLRLVAQIGLNILQQKQQATCNLFRLSMVQKSKEAPTHFRIQLDRLLVTFALRQVN